jgi:hypothetical protein
VRANARVEFTWVQLDESCCFRFNADGKDMVVGAFSPQHLLEICDVVLRLLAVIAVHSVRLQKWSAWDAFALIHAPSLAYMLEQCQSLKDFTLISLEMDENLCRVLGAYSRPDLEIDMIECKLTRTGTSALAEVLGRSQGPTKLDWCTIMLFSRMGCAETVV